jgi:BASS family bile acid:Na+ symporter
MQFMTPLLASKLAGQYIAVDPMGLFVSTSQVLPVSVKKIKSLGSG